jgi:pyruvate kinase
LASFRPTIPVIAFTKSDDTYRYINMLWWVRGYKISPNFNYQNLKQIGKEMIRMMFKWSISLDEKIVIVQVNESVTDEANMINGIELYKFKDI